MKFKTVVRLMLGIVMGICASGIGAVSIQNLIDQHKMPKIRGIGVTLLDLSGLGITDLTGLSNIPGIEKVKVLRLANNDIKKIPAEAFKAAKELRALGLSGNGLEFIEPGAFKGLGKLRVLVLNSNKINDIPKKGLSGLSRNLWLLALGSNPIPADKIKDVKKQVRRAYVMTLPVTAANLKRVGAVAVGLVMLAMATVGVVYTAKELSKEEKEEKPLSEEEKKESAYTKWEERVKSAKKDIEKALATGLTYEVEKALAIHDIGALKKGPRMRSDAKREEIERLIGELRDLEERSRPVSGKYEGIRGAIAEVKKALEAYDYTGAEGNRPKFLRLYEEKDIDGLNRQFSQSMPIPGLEEEAIRSDFIELGNAYKRYKNPMSSVYIE